MRNKEIIKSLEYLGYTEIKIIKEPALWKDIIWISWKNKHNQTIWLNMNKDNIKKLNHFQNWQDYEW